LLTGGSDQELAQGRRVIAVIQGDAVPQRFIPNLIRLWRAGRFPFDRLIRFYDFADINHAIADEKRGRAIKAVVRLKASQGLGVGSRLRQVTGSFHPSGLPDRLGCRSVHDDSSGEPMRYLALVLAIVGAATAARAQDAIPDIKGTWVGKGKVIVFGNNVHNPGQQSATEPPRVREIEINDDVEGQDGRLYWALV